MAVPIAGIIVGAAARIGVQLAGWASRSGFARAFAGKTPAEAGLKSLPTAYTATGVDNGPLGPYDKNGDGELSPEEVNDALGLPPHGPWTPPGRFPDPQPNLDEELPVNSSPLILDLDGDGVEAGAAVFFDHEGDGFMELTRWVGEDDGMLVWDRNGDGVINDGSELFGNNTVLANGENAANGFAALAELDSNGDGVVNAQDENFADLRVMRWTDANDNGMMDDGEERLETLAAAGVQSLNTAFVNSDKVDEHGNENRQVGSFTKTDGTTSDMLGNNPPESPLFAIFCENLGNFGKTIRNLEKPYFFVQFRGKYVYNAFRVECRE